MIPLNPLQNPTIELLGLRIDEPVTTFTDMIVAAIGILGYLKIAKIKNLKYVSIYSYFVLGTAISALVGGLLGHAFLYKFGYEVKMVVWVLSILGTCFAQFGALYHAQNRLSVKRFNTLLMICYFEVIVSMIILIIWPSFIVVICHTIFGLVCFVTVLEGMNYSKVKSQLSLMMIYSVALATVAAVFHTTKISISKWFNYMDISHMFLALSLFVIIKGVLFEQKNNPVTT